jgi:hypothetical protein
LLGERNSPGQLQRSKPSSFSSEQHTSHSEPRHLPRETCRHAHLPDSLQRETDFITGLEHCQLFTEYRHTALRQLHAMMDDPTERGEAEALVVVVLQLGADVRLLPFCLIVARYGSDTCRCADVDAQSRLPRDAPHGIPLPQGTRRTAADT